MGLITDALDRARRESWTRPLPKSAGARVRLLIKAAKGSTKAVAEKLGVSQRTVQRYAKDQMQPKGARAAKLEGEAAKVWQPRVTKRAAQRGITVETRARFGFTAPAGTTDDGRMRRLTQGMPDHLVGDLWRAHESGDEARLQELIAEGLGEAYFRDGGRRADGLEVRLTDIDYIDVGLR